MYRFLECLEFLGIGVHIHCQNLESKAVVDGDLS
jgi:hypothetical protein